MLSFHLLQSLLHCILRNLLTKTTFYLKIWVGPISAFRFATILCFSNFRRFRSKSSITPQQTRKWSSIEHTHKNWVTHRERTLLEINAHENRVAELWRSTPMTFDFFYLFIIIVIFQRLFVTRFVRFSNVYRLLLTSRVFVVRGRLAFLAVNVVCQTNFVRRNCFVYTCKMRFCDVNSIAYLYEVATS